MPSDTHPLLGRNWLGPLKLNWPKLLLVRADEISPVKGLCNKYPNLFEEGLGTFVGTKAKIHVPSDAAPIYCKARPVPYVLKDRIEAELDRLVQQQTIEPVDFSEWAAPIVPLIKVDKSLRICGDYKVTVNKVCQLDNYPIPKTEDLFVTLKMEVRSLPN